MTKEEKAQYILLSRRRYGELGCKKEKGSFLDEFCAATGMSRKNAIRRLSPHAPARRRRGRPFKADMRARRLLVRIWKLAGRPCGKLLRPVLGVWVGSLRRRGEEVPEETAAAVVGMSASTIDRRLRGAKPRAGRWRRASSLSEHRMEVPLKVDVWPRDAASRAGWVEVDTVAHCGGSMAGSFCWTLTLADVATQWVEMRCTWNNGAEAVVGRLGEMAGALPFAVAGVNSDNGPEFLNGHLRRNFGRLFPGAARTRSRPYRKNDNAHVEQKNGHRVRRLFGFGRLDVPEAVEAMNEAARLQSLYDNLYRPTQKLLSKTREGHRYRKVFEKEARTPAQRVLEDPGVGEAMKEKVRALLGRNDPAELRKSVREAMDRMWRAFSLGRRGAAAGAGVGSALRAAPPGTPPPRPCGGPGGMAPSPRPCKATPG